MRLASSFIAHLSYYVYVILCAFRHVLSDVEIALNTLWKSCEFEGPCVSLVAENAYSDDTLTYSGRDAEASLIFNICAIAEIGNNKSNLIGVSESY